MLHRTRPIERAQIEEVPDEYEEHYLTPLNPRFSKIGASRSEAQLSQQTLSTVDSRDAMSMVSTPPTAFSSPSPKMAALGSELDDKAKREALDRLAGPNVAHFSLAGGCGSLDLDAWLNIRLPQMVNRLRSLDLSDCKLTRLPSCLTLVTRLEELDLSRNAIAQDSVDELGNLTALRVLILDGMSLNIIPSGLNQLRRLQVLSLQQNQLTRVPCWLYLLPKLKRIYLADNPFQPSWENLLHSLWSQLSSPMVEDAVKSSRASVYTFNSIGSSSVALSPADFARDRPRTTTMNQNVLNVKASGPWEDMLNVQRYTAALLRRLRELEQEAQPSPSLPSFSTTRPHSVRALATADGTYIPSSAQSKLSGSSMPFPARASIGWIKEITNELITSEESYIRVLQELNDLYVTAARSILPPTDHALIFGHIKPILSFHKDTFLPTLTAAAAEATSARTEEDEEDATIAIKLVDALAKALTLHESSLRMYSLYLDDYDASQARVSEWLRAPKSKVGAMVLSAMKKGKEAQIAPQQRKKFQVLVQTCKIEAKHSQHSLQGYLMLPAQRIQRYQRLLENCILCLTKARLPRSLSLNVALEQILGISRKIDQTGLRKEQEAQLALWESRIEGDFKLVQPGRRLVREGTLTLRRIIKVVAEGAGVDGTASDTVEQESLTQQVTLILCNDVCLMVKEALSPAGYPYVSLPPEKRPLELVVTLKIRPSFVFEDSPGLNCQLFGITYLRISDPKVCLYFSASTAADASSWCECINNAALI